MIEKGKIINDRYEIIKSIGEGGMANVYVGFDKILERKVAIKVLRGDLSNDEKFVRRFQREALSASSLSHPNIVEMYDVGEDNGIYYIIMEYVEGKTLKQLIKKRGTITLSEAIDIMLQLTDGITQAHDSYIIHRDLKPQNILIKEDGQIKITDFGIAVALNSTQLTQTNSVMGSVHYLPPEQASGKGSTIKSDIYSMGILFYELLTGSLPFKGDNAVEIALKQIHDPIPSVRKKNQTIPQSVENIILKATAKNPKNRYKDAKEMHNDLLTALDEDKKDVPRLIFQYPEHEENEKINLKKTEDKKEKVSEEKKEIADENEKKEDKKEEVAVKVQEKENEEEYDDDFYDDKTINGGNKIILVLLSLICVIVVIGISAVLILPKFTKIPEIKVPDVSGMTVIEAEKTLKDAGFEVASETIKEINESVPKEIVIKTEPKAERLRKKGEVITIYESLGEEIYVMENFVGQNYLTVKAILESKYELKVKVEKKDVDDISNIDEQQIVEQSVKEGTKLGSGSEVTLYIPNIIEGYPDFVEDNWSVEEIEEFCSQYGIILKINYEETLQYADGMIISQSRTPESPIVKGVTLKITVAKTPEVTDPDDETNENTTSSNVLSDLLP